MRVVSLFSGIGGFDLALERLGHTTIAYSEVDPWASSVMAVRFPQAKPLGDITKIDWSQVERPDILCGGFPCQPHSVAGARQGAADARDLWPECIRALRDLRPRLALFENVRGLLTSGGGGVFNRCLSDLADLGYDAEWQVLSAADVGAPHRRGRVWIVARRDGAGCEQFRIGWVSQDGDPQPRRDAVRCDRAWLTPRTEDGESTGISATRRALGIADNLPSAVVQWRTPDTPSGGVLSEDRKIAKNHCINLQDQVELPSAVWQWRTPSDPTKRGGSQSAEKRAEGGHTVNLEDQLDNPTGKLNPDWVEALMGYPIGWSDPAVPNQALVYTPFPAGRGPQYEWEPPRVTIRKDGRRKRLRCLGNAIVPACLKAVLSASA